MLMLLFAGGLAPLVEARAHGVIGGEDSGNWLFWLYGLVAAAIIGFIGYRKWWAGKISPERRALRQQLRDFEHALNSCRTQLQNAVDYPKECGLTESQRLDQVQSAALIEEKIDEIKAELAAA